MSLLMVSLDVSIVNVALPSIRRDFRSDIAGLQWTVDGYTLVLAIFLLLSGSVADRFGRRSTFQFGLSIFTAGSLLCSVAPGLEWLIVARMIQAVGGSMLNPVALAIIGNTFIDPKERARALGVWGAVVGISLGLGPLVGGLLVTADGWRSIFLINLPLGVAAVVLASVFVPESRALHARTFDPLGQLFVAVVLASVITAIIEAPDLGWSSWQVLGLFGLSAAGTAALLVAERYREQPLLELRFFRSAPFTGATVAALVSFAALASFIFVNSLYLQDVRGLSPLDAGLATLPMAALTALLAPISGRLVAARGARLPLVAAGVAISIGASLLLTVTPTTPLALLLVSYALVGIGFGMVNAPVTNTALSAMPADQAGVAAAIASVGRQTGAALGVAVTGSLLAGVGDGGDFSSASHVAWALIVGMGVMVSLLGIISTSRWARATATDIDDARQREQKVA